MEEQKLGLYSMRTGKDAFLFRVASAAHDVGFSPNTVTALGLCFGVSAGFMLAFHEMPLALTLGFLSVFCDVLDGTIARKFRLETTFGRVFDSASDRVCEVAVVLGAFAGGIVEPLGLAAIAGSMMLFVLRALSHIRGLKTDYVMFGRPERLVFLLLGLLMPFAQFSTACFVVAGGFGFVSSLQIIVVLWRQNIKAKQAERSQEH